MTALRVTDVADPAYRYRAVVRRVIDGDTVDMDVDMGFRAWRMKERFRLSGIDAPELRGEQREAGLAAKAWLEERLPVGMTVTIETGKDPDVFGRWIAAIWMGETCVNAEMVAEGHAVWRNY